MNKLNYALQSHPLERKAAYRAYLAAYLKINALNGIARITRPSALAAMLSMMSHINCQAGSDKICMRIAL